MIKLLTTTAKARTPVHWWSKVFPKAQTWKLEPGINILWGPNGSGKSTILLMLARLHHCVQTGRTLVTANSLRDLNDGRLADGAPVGIKVQHDGKELRYFSPEHVVGRDQYGEMDWDVGEGALGAFLLKGSTGQLNRHRLIKILEPKRDKTIQWHWQAAKNKSPLAKWTRQYLKGAIRKPGMVTVLLDEPDAGLDWPHKQDMWQFLNKTANVCQWIIASHSIFALNHPTAHYLELKPGYLEECRKVLKDLLKGVET